MNIDQRLKAFASLGHYLRNINQEEMQTLTDAARNQNPWFTPFSVTTALGTIAEFLTEDSLKKWVKNYNLSTSGKRVGVVLAGNIPFVGFHDVLCILVSGNIAFIKMSSKDQVLMNFILEKLVAAEPDFAPQIVVTEQLKNFDAVIATGSDNTSRYFEFYFGKYPHIIRKNRTSVAILDGTENKQDLAELGKDVFTYFGLGCRNVSKLYVPQGYSFNHLFESWEGYADIIHHHKYCNNYDYQKSILLVNRQEFLDNGFVIVQQSDKIVSPISVVYYETYVDDSDLKAKIASMREKIQVIVGRGPSSEVSFGNAQCPDIDDYADGIDTLRFLEGLK
jgi:hypothetical protein